MCWGISKQTTNNKQQIRSKGWYCDAHGVLVTSGRTAGCVREELPELGEAKAVEENKLQEKGWAEGRRLSEPEEHETVKIGEEENNHPERPRPSLLFSCFREKGAPESYLGGL